MIKVGVLGARGRMGSTVCETIEGAPDTELAARVDQGDALNALLGCDVVVDFTHVAAVMDNLRWCVAHGLDVVVGTSGFGDERLAEVRTKKYRIAIHQPHRISQIRLSISLMLHLLPVTSQLHPASPGLSGCAHLNRVE